VKHVGVHDVAIDERGKLWMRIPGQTCDTANDRKMIAHFNQRRSGRRMRSSCI